MNAESLKSALNIISRIMTDQKDYLIELDSQNGDGDLGISMASGYAAVASELSDDNETDLGKLLMKVSGTFNEAAPSSLGTITSFGIMGMAKELKGKTEASVAEVANAMEAGLNLIMEKAKSKPGEKTILDALDPAIKSLRENASSGSKIAFAAAAKAAAEGSESTREMYSVHGRAAYYREKSLGVLDGGSVVGRLIFEGIAESIN